MQKTVREKFFLRNPSKRRRLLKKSLMNIYQNQKNHITLFLGLFFLLSVTKQQAFLNPFFFLIQ
jgi:hypothetical protein